MTAHAHDATITTATAARPARRVDAGSVRLSQRDIDGLLLCGEHYGVPLDLLAAALRVQPGLLPAIMARWRRAGYAATGRLGPGPGWCWLTRDGMLPGAEDADVGGVHDADGEPGIPGGVVGEVPGYVGTVPGRWRVRAGDSGLRAGGGPEWR
jgi:hypothetical protein